MTREIPVCCAHCYIRFALSEPRQLYHNRLYHRHCVKKILHLKTKSGDESGQAGQAAQGPQTARSAGAPRA